MARKQARSQDVATLAGVSRTTVSFVLNDVPGVKISEVTRRRVREAARELNYYPTAAARSLASGKTVWSLARMSDTPKGRALARFLGRSWCPRCGRFLDYTPGAPMCRACEISQM